MVKLLFISLLALASYAHEGENHIHGSSIFQKKCFVCHRVKTSESAPPIFAIKKVYMDRYKEIALAKEKIGEFLSDYKKPIMKPAVKKFGVMPPLLLTETEKEEVAKFLIESNHPKPEWFKKHYKEHLKSGKLSHPH